MYDYTIRKKLHKSHFNKVSKCCNTWKIEIINELKSTYVTFSIRPDVIFYNSIFLKRLPLYKSHFQAKRFYKLALMGTTRPSNLKIIQTFQPFYSV